MGTKTHSIPFAGEKHELHPTKQINVLGKSVSTPSIVVHVADDEQCVEVGFGVNGSGHHGHHHVEVAAVASVRRVRPHTRCPDRQASLD